MNTLESVWRKLSKSKKYREEFALSFLKSSVPFQVRTLRRKHCGSQATLAERARLTQGVVSRAEDPEYGNLTFNTIGKIAAGLDMAFVGRFVSFGELVRFSLELSEQEFENIPNFVEESALVNQIEDISGLAIPDAQSRLGQSTVISGEVFEQMQKAALGGSGDQTSSQTYAQTQWRMPFPPSKTIGDSHGAAFGAAG